MAVGLVFSCAFAQTRAPKSVKQPRERTKAPEKQKAPPPQDLTRAETIPFGGPAAVGASARNYCDAEGNVYLQYTTAKPRIGPGQVVVPVSPQNQPVTKLSLDSQSTTEFAVHSLDGYRSLTPILFSVDQGGEVYRLYQAQPASLPYRGFLSLRYVVVKFNEDGSVDSAVRLQNPPHSMLDVTSFVAFADGNLLATGILSPAPASESDEAGTPYTPRLKIVHHTPSGYGPFTGIFDSSGRFVQQLTLPGDVNSHPHKPRPRQVGFPRASGEKPPTLAKAPRPPSRQALGEPRNASLGLQPWGTAS